MRAIGHYDFGKNLRPVDFDGWIDSRRSYDAQSLAYWLEYWVVTYRHLLTDIGQLTFVSYEGLCADPERGLHRLTEAIGSENGHLVPPTAATLRAPRAREMNACDVDPSLVDEAFTIHGRLKDAAL
jgi:hypothetical protein